MAIELSEIGINSASNKGYTVYNTRYLVAMLLCVSVGLSGYLLSTFVSICDMSMDYFQTDSMGINMFSLVYMIFYFPGSILSIYITEKFGVGTAIWAGALANFFASWIKYAGAYNQRYEVVLFGQIIAAMGQPLLLNAPSRIANDWFPVSERDFAMHVMTQANNIGGGLGVLIPAYQVLQESDIPNALLWIAIAGTGILFFSLCFIRDRPPSPPGRDVEEQIQIRSAMDNAGIQKMIFQMFNDFYVMLHNVNFVLLLIAYSFMLGVSWAFMAVVGQMIGPCEYDTETVGIAGSSLSFSGVVGSFAIALLLRYTADHMRVQKFVFLATMATAIWCLGVNKPGSIDQVLASWTVFGFFQGPLMPVCLEQAAEIVYPIPANSVAALMFTGLNCVTLALTLGLTPLLLYDDSANCTSIVTPAAALVFFFAIVGAGIALLVKPEFRRMDVAQQGEKTSTATTVQEEGPADCAGNTGK